MAKMSVKEVNKLKDKDVRRFTLEGIKTEAKVLSIQDGGNCDLAFYRNEELMRFNCSLEDVKAQGLDKPNGELARDYLAYLCRGEDPDQFEGCRSQSKKDLQRELDKNENLVYAVFGKPDKNESGFPVTLKVAQKGKSINTMMKTFIGKLE